MSTCVCVLSNSGERLMPTIRLGKVRRLLKDGKAKIIKHHPFTIQLLYDSETNIQPIEICEGTFISRSLGISLPVVLQMPYVLFSMRTSAISRLRMNFI